jgi:hypothetical protein
VDRHKPADLLIVTRAGITPDARAFVESEQANLRHQTIWQIENDVLGLTEYTRVLSTLDETDGLKSYYIPQTCTLDAYDPDNPREGSQADEGELLDVAQTWLGKSTDRPLAILGSYGAGKTSFARTWISKLAGEALTDPSARIPIYIRLGAFVSYTAIESVIGMMFGSEFPVTGFSVPTFLESNRRGRFVVICDGFDEMKHAMSWADFRSMVTELTKLNSGNAKLVIIGRPSAFLTDDEHFHVLRGHKRIGEQYHRLPDWPQFLEYSVVPFDQEMRERFIRLFIEYRATQQRTNKKTIQERIDRVINLANSDEDIFSKPVHAKILTELGASPTFDLQSFTQGVTRWDLYEAFFSALTERELAKEARRPVAEQERLKFLEELAFWLWTEGDGKPSFSADEIPSYILTDLYDGQASDGFTKLREYLTGAFLERKQGDIYFFGHRSFLEFLVAARMIRVTPEGRDHHWYGKCLKGPVKDFFVEGARKRNLNDWADSLGDFNGEFDLAYFRFIRTKSKPFREIRRNLPEGSSLRRLFRHFDDNAEMTVATERRLISEMPKGSHETALLCLQLLNLSFRQRDMGRDSVDRALLQDLAQQLWKMQTYFPKAVTENTFQRSYVVDGKLLKEFLAEQSEKFPMQIVDTDAKFVSDGWPDIFAGRSSTGFSRINLGRFR